MHIIFLHRDKVTQVSDVAHGPLVLKDYNVIRMISGIPSNILDLDIFQE
jgi:hypothetical protein